MLTFICNTQGWNFLMNQLRLLLFVLAIAFSVTAVTIVLADDPPPSTNGQPEPQIVGGQVASLGD